MKRTELTLSSGRTIHLTSLRQEAVYYGLLEGLPTREMNAESIEELRSQARERTGFEPYLIEPTQKPIQVSGPYPFGEPAALPAISCVAEFVSSGKDPDYSSHLTVIWFQEDYAFPIEPQIEASLVALDWDRLAAQSVI